MRSFPDDWDVGIASPVKVERGEEELVCKVKDGIDVLFMVDHAPNEILAILQSLSPNKPRHLGKLVLAIRERAGPSDPDDQPTATAMLLDHACSLVNKLGLYLDPLADIDASEQLACIIANIPHVRCFREVSFHVSPQDLHLLSDQYEALLAISLPRWTTKPWTGLDSQYPRKVSLDVEVFDADNFERIEDPTIVALLTRLLRFAAHVMLLIGGPGAEYRLALGGVRPKSNRYSHAALKVIHNMFERILLDEIGRLISDGQKGGSVGWRKLEVAERRPN